MPADSTCLPRNLLNNLHIMQGDTTPRRFTAPPVPHLRRA